MLNMYNLESSPELNFPWKFHFESIVIKYMPLILSCNCRRLETKEFLRIPQFEKPNMSEFKRLEHLTLWSTPDKFWIESSKVKTTHLLQVSRDVVGGPCQVTMEPHLGQIPASANRKTIYGVLGIHTLPLGQVSWSSTSFLEVDGWISKRMQWIKTPFPLKIGTGGDHSEA